MLADSVRQYHALHEQQIRPHLYTTPWWLDTVCGTGGWNAVFQTTEGNSLSALPYCNSPIRGLKAIFTPPLTQWTSIVGLSPGAEVDLKSWYELLPKRAILDLSIQQDDFTLLPHQHVPVTTKYSYMLPYKMSIEEMTSGYNEGLRRNLKQGQSKFEIIESEDADILIRLCRSTYQQQDLKSPWWVEGVLPGLVRALLERNAGHLSIVIHQSVAIAAMLTAWDDGASYYIVGGRMATEEGTSAHAILLDHAIRQAQKRGNAFDFEGSMIPGIANFFQSFGAKPMPYYQLRQYRGFGLAWRLFH
ncbi:MAG TPA: GNAT family N-acetyltransferase [Saprospiraceae bacterium]|nr:GNAT family N-acetyltransferase [Saprospiraceae bacterium]